MRSRFFVVATMLFASVAAMPANADVYCGGTGPVNRVLTYADGSVLVNTNWRGDFIAICNLTTTWKGVQPSTCFAWMSQIAAAVTANKSTGFWYGGFSDPRSCATMPTYFSAPAPVYIDIAP
jgi:hypothetical protein